MLRLLEMMRRYRFALHLDVKKYFPSIDLGILRRLLAERIRDARFLALLDRVIDAGAGLYDNPLARALAGLGDTWPPPGRGLPIGAYTSQLFAAHVYLCAFDHFVKRRLKVPGYLRYVDDMFFFGHGRAELRHWRKAVEDWLADRRGLRLKYPTARILSCRGHLDELGYRIRREGLQPLPRGFHHLRSQVRGAAMDADGRRQRFDLGRSMAASAGVILF